MPEVNPFASPSTVECAAPVAAEEWQTKCLYRQGRLLVMHKKAVLPDRCVKSNRPAAGRLKRKLSWHHPVLYILVVSDIVVYVVLALLLRKRATIDVGLSDEWFRKRRRAITAGWTLFIGGLAMLIVGIASAAQHRWVAIAIPLGLFIALAGTIYGLRVAGIVRAKQVTNHFIWLAGVHPDFLASLPIWPYKP
jgi:hypothetical protein